MFVERCFDNTDKTMDNKMVMESKMMDSSCSNMGMGCGCAPVMECPVERVCHRNICYDVPHYIPVNTRFVNHHIYRHTYQPVFTCTSEDEVCHIYDNKCGF